MLSAFTFFQSANYIEAAFWWVVALGFAVATVYQPPSLRVICWVGMVLFALFGLSDVVEAHTGAWYEPWWLLAWKALCLAVIAGLLVDQIRRRRRAR